jgi:large subunit ribosomal protein L6
MSRLGKQPIQIPDGVEITLSDKEAVVKGSKGTLAVRLSKKVTVKQEEKALILSIANPDDGAMWGTTWSNLKNAIEGVSQGFEKKLEINGVGFRANAQGKKLVMNLGFSHQVEMEAPEGIEFSVEKNLITVSGYDKQKVGQFAAEIRAKKKPEPYKGKGIKYIDEHIRRKAGKKAVASE